MEVPICFLLFAGILFASSHALEKRSTTSASIVHGDTKLEHMLTSPNFKDTGHATNCGSVPIKLSWTPKNIHPYNATYIYIEYIMPHNFDHGFLVANLSFAGDKEPFVGVAEEVKCTDAHDYIPTKFCPLKKGLPIKQTVRLADTHGAASYQGTYDAMASLTNQDGQLMFCVKLTLTVDKV